MNYFRYYIIALLMLLRTNTVGCNSCYNFLGGGELNIIGSTVLASTGSNFNVIAGGCRNVICNNVFCSAILGGSGNIIPVGCNYVGIFGHNIGTVAGCVQNNTFHVNKLYADSIPNVAAIAGCPTGTIYWDAPGAAGKVLYIV